MAVASGGGGAVLGSGEGSAATGGGFGCEEEAELGRRRCGRWFKAVRETGGRVGIRAGHIRHGGGGGGGAVLS